MKSIVKKLFKTLLVFIISTIIVYLVFSAKALYTWCNKNELFLFTKNVSVEQFMSIDKDKIQKIGDTVGSYAQLMEDSLDEPYSEDTILVADFYDPLGFSVWSYMQDGIEYITTRYVTISLLLGLSITISYIVITSKKLNNILKFILGYISVIIIIPPIYMYSYTYRFWDIASTYSRIPKYFYIGYTVIFILMYVINYIVGKKMTKELNQTIKNTSHS